MTTQRSLDVSTLPTYEISSQAPLWWGQLSIVFIEGTMFGVLVAMYFYIRTSVDVWPPPGTQIPHLMWPSIALAPLVLSALGSYWASEAAKKDDRRGMTLGLSLNVVMALAFLAMRWMEWHSFNFNWAANAFGSIVWTILFLHTFDAVADIGFTVVLLAIVISGRHGAKQRLGVHVDSVVWYFIVAIWLLLYVVIYWGPYLVGAPG